MLVVRGVAAVALGVGDLQGMAVQFLGAHGMLFTSVEHKKRIWSTGLLDAVAAHKDAFPFENDNKKW